LEKFKVGITGQSGFMGSHLFNYLSLKSDKIDMINFEDAYFEDNVLLQNFVQKCDTIIHLAALNRHNNPQVIYDTNVRLVQTLLGALEQSNCKPHIVFASSIQESRDNPYGKSKKAGRQLLMKWAEVNDTKFTGLMIPNVFGPFGNPHYNSVIATFCHQLTHDATPKIEIDGELNLIYINDLAEVFYNAVTFGLSEKQSELEAYSVPSKTKIRVSDILAKLETYKKMYFEQGIFPFLADSFQLALFNTFRCYMPNNKFPVYYKKHSDERGDFVEIARTNSEGQFSFSTTKPGITRGNHYHTRKVERFSVIKGKARIQLRKINTVEVITYELDGNNPSYVDMPIWYTHNITNIGNEDLITLFWINEPFDPENPDTYFENV